MSELVSHIASIVTPNVRTAAYLIGAAVLILAALFKRNHWPGATAVLIIMMVTETAVFAISALPQPEDKKTR